LAEIAEDYVERFDEYFNVFMADFISKDIENPDERDKLRLKLVKLRSKDQNNE